MENNVNDIFETKDLAISAYLYSTRFVHFLGKRKLPTGETVLQFSPKSRAEDLVQDYWDLQAPEIQPKLLFSAQRDLKDIIFGM